ncbi:Hypothetical predicted protein [Mytilus galloprovincialis]|uniref:Uncharacterized protein n=1 Tax=Mytilus galloprovincialis TaxID=29158 RepID=A0A8B6EYF1_MYTGA|nr:Hypothetical predicted protein [Mytilus galloprovincialis]
MSMIRPTCDLEFSGTDVMLRRHRNKHGANRPYPSSSHSYPPNNDAYPPPPPPPPYSPPPQPTQKLVLHHSFTMMLAGPTGSGKSFWMKSILEKAKTMIVPSPEKNIWCYNRWQPLFSEMKKTIKIILFVQGLPENLNDDSFLDSRYLSLIILAI